MTRHLTLAAILCAGLTGCGKAQEGHLLYGTEMLMECRFDDAVLAARDVRGIGPEDSEEFLISLLLEGAAVKGQGGDPTSQFEEFASRSASVTSVLEAEELAMQSFGPFVDRCRN